MISNLLFAVSLLFSNLFLHKFLLVKKVFGLQLDNVSDTQNERQIFHEKQEGYLCAQHCLNALLQGPHFNAVDLAELAQEMDFAEKTRMAEAGYDGKDYQSFIKKPSENMDDTGYFSVQVISCALEIWGLDMIPYKSSDPRAVSARSNKKTVDAFICNSNSHWFTIRRLGKQWYNLNSTLCKPEPISDLYLELFLEEFQQEGNVFIVLGPLPDSYGKNNNYAIIGHENHAKPKRTEESGKTEEPDDTDYLNLSVENVSESLLTKEQFKEFLVHRGQKWFRK